MTRMMPMVDPVLSVVQASLIEINLLIFFSVINCFISLIVWNTFISFVKLLILIIVALLTLILALDHLNYLYYINSKVCLTCTLK